MTAHRRQDKISQWAVALRERSGWQRAVVALANKNARILWAGNDHAIGMEPRRAVRIWVRTDQRFTRSVQQGRL